MADDVLLGISGGSAVNKEEAVGRVLVLLHRAVQKTTVLRHITEQASDIYLVAVDDALITYEVDRLTGEETLSEEAISDWMLFDKTLSSRLRRSLHEHLDRRFR
jgi:hypothetical protein